PPGWVYVRTIVFMHSKRRIICRVLLHMWKSQLMIEKTHIPSWCGWRRCCADGVQVGVRDWGREVGTYADVVMWGQNVANLVIFNCRSEGVSLQSSSMEGCGVGQETLCTCMQVGHMLGTVLHCVDGQQAAINRPRSTYH